MSDRLILSSARTTRVMSDRLILSSARTARVMSDSLIVSSARTARVMSDRLIRVGHGHGMLHHSHAKVIVKEDAIET